MLARLRRMQQKQASTEEQDELTEEQQLEEAMVSLGHYSAAICSSPESFTEFYDCVTWQMAARAVAAVRQAEEMAAEPAVRTHTKFDDDGNVITTYEEQVYDGDGVLRGATSSDEGEDETEDEDEDTMLDDETMATIMDAAAAMETIVFTSGEEPASPVAGIAADGGDLGASEWRGTHMRFDDEEEEDEEVVVGRNKNATTSGKSKGEILTERLSFTTSTASYPFMSN